MHNNDIIFFNFFWERQISEENLSYFIADSEFGVLFVLYCACIFNYFA